MPSLMCIVPASLDELEKKGVQSHILQRDLGGYWDKVITVHPFCKEYSMHVLNERHIVYEAPSRDIIKTIWSLPGIAKKYKVDAVKAHDPYWTAFIACIVAKVCRISFTIGVYASYELMWKVEHRWANGVIRSRLVDKVLAWVMFRLADRVQPGSLDAMYWAVRSGAKRKKTVLVRTGGVDKIHFEPLDKRQNLKTMYPELKDKNIILSCGRLVPIRTPLDVIWAFRYIIDYDTNSLLVIIGDGPLKEDMQKYAERLKLSEKVLFLGFIPQAGLRDWLYTADVILCPLGGSGLVESCLSGTPVVAYDIDWHGELVLDKLAGRLVPYRNYILMANAAIELLKDPLKADGMGKTARERAITIHSLEKVQNDEKSLFKELMK